MSNQSTAQNPGKGDNIRPRKVSWKEFSESWDAIFPPQKKCCGGGCGCHPSVKDEKPIVIQE